MQKKQNYQQTRMGTKALDNKLQNNTLAQKIWKEELESFVPSKIFDAHTHVFYGNKEIDPGGGIQKGEEVGVNMLLEWDTALYPGRAISYFLIGMPLKKLNIIKMADFTIRESRKYNDAFPVIVVKPGMDEKKLYKYVELNNVIGFKPYRYFSTTGDIDECRTTDFLPESIIKIADKYKLLIVLHLSKRKGAADEGNKKDLIYLAEKYPNIKLQLAHCARSFNPSFMEKSIGYLKSIPNIYFDTSAVCESDVFDILLSEIDSSHILFGSDNMPIHIEGGKYVSYGNAWMFLSTKSCNLNLTHCDPKPIPVVYEELRALKRAVKQNHLNRGEIQNIFYNNAKRLLESIISQF